jgi:cytochrome b561
MPIRNTPARWGSVAQLIHWVIVVLIVTQFVLAYSSQSLPLGMAKLAMLARHKSWGITILALAIIRLVWRLVNRESPPLPNTLKPWERAAAHVTHYGLYALLFAMPLTGWAMSSARQFPVSWFNLVQLPDFVAANRPLYDVLHSVHMWLSWALIAVAVLHIGAALKHHFVLKDTVLKRMLPFTKT